MRIRMENKHYSNSINSISFEDFAFILSGTFILEIIDLLSVMALIQNQKIKKTTS